MGLCTPSYEIVSEVNKPSCLGLSKVGTAHLGKVVAVLPRGWHLPQGTHSFHEAIVYMSGIHKMTFREAGEVAHWAKYLPKMHEIMSSICRTCIKKRNEKRLSMVVQT